MYLRQHKDDKDMLEIFTKNGKSGKIDVWAIIYDDFIYDEFDEDDRSDLNIRLNVGQEIEIVLVPK